MQELYKGRYQRIERVGNGAYGVIYKVRSLPEGKLLIAKHIALQNLQREKALQEFDILGKLRHHYIVRYVDSFAWEDELVLIMEYCGEKDLAWHIEQRRQAGKHFSEYLVTNWILQMLLAVGFMHSNRIVHRDLKPQNIFVDSDMNLKVGDFGIARLLDSTAQHCNTSAGTPSYMAPEMVESEDYSFKADIWSLGCVIYEVCALDRLFPTKDAQDKPIGIFKMMDLIRQGDLKDIPSMYSDDLKKLVKKMLVRNPQKRPKAEDLLKDKLLVQLMINRINQKDNLKQEYPKGIEVPSLTESILDRQTHAVKDQLKKLELEVNEKMQGMKNKKIEKGQLAAYQKEIKMKMIEVEKAVKLAFAELNKKAKFAQGAPNAPKEQEPARKVDLSTLSNSKMDNSSLQNSSDITIQSMQITSKPKIHDNQSSIEMVESLMLQSGLKTKNKSKASKFSSTLRSQIQKSKQLTQQDPFEGTIQSQYAQTLQTMQDPQIITTATMNKLDLLQKTLQKNPQALLSQSFLTCTLSLSHDPVQLNKEEEFSLTNNNSISFDLTKQSKRSDRLEQSKPQGLQKSSKNEDFDCEYKADFEQYEQNEEMQERRASELQTMLSLYQQTLADLGHNQEGISEASKLRNKYLVMSEIKQQSNEGGSMISRNESIQ